MMALEEAAAPQIDASLEIGKVTAGARIGEVLVAVVDLLPEEAHPAGAKRTVLGVGQRIADALVQRAERREAELSPDGRRRIRFRQLYAAFKRLPLCTTLTRHVGPNRLRKYPSTGSGLPRFTRPLPLNLSHCAISTRINLFKAL
ncbi:hypothetical protein [Paraburkholderia mimosarum]|uniref:hypothetical protein n=3 Tax=Paraburkholderia mimosarum TaxID=312026 RepID=UPI001FC862EF|nr:hypothetical protein [Paraburkholderia mimosarum]